MRIVHLADTHLGFKQFSAMDHARGLNQRECDVYAAWHRAIEMTIELQPDAVVHAGDLFDSARPSFRAMAEAIDGFTRLQEAGVPAIVIAGNHETPRFRSGGSVFEVLERVSIEAVWSEPRTIRVGSLALHAVPHEPHAEALERDILGLSLDTSADANVLVMHTGLETVKSSYSEVNQVELDPEALTRVEFDYIALGDLHRFQAPQVNAAYPGSLERLDFNDLDGEKAVLEVDLSAGARNREFLRRHEYVPRLLVDLQVDCTECGPDVVLARLKGEIEGRELDGAVARLRLEAVERDVYHALDFDLIDHLLAPCLHKILSVGRGGLRTAGASDGSELSFEAFARASMPATVDADAVVTIARRFLDDAAAEEAEAQA